MIPFEWLCTKNEDHSNDATINNGDRRSIPEGYRKPPSYGAELKSGVRVDDSLGVSEGPTRYSLADRHAKPSDRRCSCSERGGYGEFVRV